jgi:Ca-activated chloride channel homolog
MSHPAPRESSVVMFIPSSRGLHRRKARPSLSVLFPLLFILGFTRSLATDGPPDKQESQAKIAVSVNLVLIPASVTDAKGAFVSGLKANEFRVLEEGQQQELTVFEVGDAPVTVGLVVDHSRSMGSKLPKVAAAVNSFAHTSNLQDEMFIVDFNDDVSIELMKGKAFTSDPKELEEALGAVAARGRTALYDAISEGLHHLQYGHWQKKALIVISDGGDNASRLKYSQVLAAARQSQALIYSIALVGSDNVEENPGLLRRLCKDTGGIAYFPREGESVESVSKEIARDLREQYTLGYIPQGMKRTDDFRKIEVRVTAPGHGKLHVRTRQGYSPMAVKLPLSRVEMGAR